MTDNKKYIINIGDHSEEWTPDMYAEAADRLFADHEDANVFELEDVGDFDEDPSDHQYVINIGDHSEVWDGDMVKEAGASLKEEHPDVKIQRVSYKDYWGERATANREQRAALLQPDADRNARLAELGYYDDLSENQLEFNMDTNLGFGLKPLSSAIETSVVTGETRYLDPAVQEFFALDSANTDRMAEIARLDAEYDSNPAVIAQREWEAQQRAEQAKYIDTQLAAVRADMDSEVDAYHAAQGAQTKHGYDPYGANMTVQAIRMIQGEDVGKDMAENEKMETYQSAIKLYEMAKQANEIAGKGFWGAAGDVAMDKLRNLATQSDIEMYNEIGDILTRLESQYGSLENLTDEQIESGLSKAEQALIHGFFAYNEAMEAAGQNMSRAYKGGKIFGESISFMLEFLATGGIAKGTGKAAGNLVSKGLLRWARKAAAGTAKRTARAFTARAARGLTSALVGTAARTLAAPGTYHRAAEESVKIEDGHLDRTKNVFKSFADSYIENLSEISGGLIGKGLGLLGKGISKAASMSGIPFSKLGSLLADNRLMQTVTAGWKSIAPKFEALGFHGIFEEIGEEYIGNAIREFTIQPGALAEMHKDDNFGAMLIGFAPMTLFGGAMSAVSIGAKNIEAANLGKKLRETLGQHYSEEQIDHMMNLVSGAENSKDVWEAIKPLTVGLNAEEAQQLFQYGAFMAQNKAMLFAKKAQDDNLAQAKRAELQQTYNKFWQQDAEGAESVQLATLNDGRTVFVVSEPTADGVVSIIDASTGAKGFTNVSNYKTEEVDGAAVPMTQTWSMDAYLESEIASERRTAEGARMEREYNEQVQNLQSQIKEGTKINLGTEGNPVIMLATGKFVKDGVVAVDQTGNTHTIGWNQVADAMNQPIGVKTDQQLIDEEMAAIVARNAERRKRMTDADPAMTDAVNESAAQSAEVVAQENRHIPMNEDGTVNEAAFWEQNPEGYVQWNDEQNQDGGADSLQQVAITKAVLTSLLAEAQQAQQTSNPAERKAAKQRAQEIAEKINRLTAIEAGYAEQRIAPLRERAMKWKSLTNAPVYIVETEEDLTSISGQAAASNKGGARVRGFAKDGRAYIYLPGIVEESEIDAVFMHEAVAHTGLKGLLGQQAFDELCDQVWEMMSPEMQTVFINYPGVNGNTRAAADEYIAHLAETMGAGIAEAEEKTIWQSIIDFVRNILRSMGIALNVSESELSDLIHMAYADLAKNIAEAEDIAVQQQEARTAEREAPSAARQEYDTYAEDLTHDEIKAVAENEFNAAQEAYNALVGAAPKVEMGESAKDFIARKKAYNEQLAEAKAALGARQALIDEIARIDAANAPVLTDAEVLEQEGLDALGLDESAAEGEDVRFSAKLSSEEKAQRRAEAKEIYSRVLKNEFNDVTLQLIDKYLQDAAGKHRISYRLPEEVERTLLEDQRTSQVDALISRISESTVPATDRSSQQGREEIEKKKKELLKNWAIASGVWYSDISEVAEIADLTPLDQGTDSIVYFSNIDGYLVKIKHGKPFGKRFRPDIDDLALYNHFFENTAYKIIGYGDFGYGISTIVMQPIVDFAEEPMVSVEDRVEYMREMGFEPMNKEKTAFTNGYVVASDIQRKNIVRDSNGDIRVIDADMKLHTRDLGGKHVVPPVESDTRLSVITPEMDADYLAAVERGDMETAQRMVLEAARLAGYDSNSDYQGTLAFNGAAPSGYAYYDTKEERIEAWESGEYEDDQTLGDYKDAGIDISNLGWSLTSPVAQRTGNKYTRESIKNLADAVNSDSRKIKVYRAVDADIKEDSVRNGDWVTPSRAYAEHHIRLQDWKEGRIIEQEVDIDDIWWDGNDINEWGYNDGKGYVYKNTPNNRKLLAPVTYDDAGNVIPLSERFNPEKDDIRFSVLDTTKAELKDKPIKLNGMHRFKVKSAFKGVKGADGSFPYLKAEIIEVSDGYNGPAFKFEGILEGFAVIFVPKGTISEGQKDNEFFIDPKAIESQLWDILKSAENYYEFKYAKGPYAHGGNWLNAEGNVLFSVSRGSLVGMHNISEEKLRKVIKQGGSANPSTAVIDIERQAFDSYGEISLIMPSSLVDAETGRNAGTFTADAWTPTYPQIEKRFSDDELQRAYWRDITAIPEEMQHEVRMAFDSWLDNRTASGLAYMFLQERGEAPEMVRVAAKFPQEIKDKMSAILGEGRTGFYELTDEEKQAVLDLYIQENFGGSREDFDSSIAETIQRIEDRLSTGKVPSFVEKRITADLQWMKEHGYNYDNISDFVRNIVSDIRHAGEVNDAATTNRALDYIKDNNLSAEYEQWKESLNDRYGIKEYLFDGYTPSGNPRWLPNTVENASKLMNKQGLAGATGMASSFNRFVATLAPKKKSLSDIRSSKDLLVEDEKLVDDFRDKWSEVFFDLGIKCQPDAKGYEDYGLERLTEAAQKKNPGAYLKKEYGVELSQDDLQRLADMIKAIKTEFPARYFETKFQRPVYLNEFTAAVMPTTTSADIKQAIAEAGLPIFEYDSTIDGARREATLKATDIEGVRFSVTFNSANEELNNTGLSMDNPVLMQEYGLSAIELSKKGNYVTLSKIVAAEQGQGNGTRFMEDLTKNADANGWILALTPDTTYGGTSVARLKKFYKRFGFKDNKGRNTDFNTKESMIRTPVRFSVFEPHNATIDEIDGLFREYNMDESLVPLYDKVSALAHTMDLKIRFDYPWSAAAGSTFGDKVKFNTEFFNSLAYKSQDKAHALLHEMIHAVTQYAIFAKNTKALTPEMKEAVKQLEDVYEEIKNDRLFAGTYGSKSVHEMVAELANPEFRDRLKAKSLYQRIVDAIKKLLGIEVGNSAFDAVSATLDYMIDNYDGTTFNAVVNALGQNESYVRFSAVQIDPAVRQEMDTIKAKAMWDGTFMKAPNGADTKLTEDQWLLVRTKNFLDWFGDWINDPENASKIVDENGEPMVVYHGSPYGAITQFDRRGHSVSGLKEFGTYFSTSKELAQLYAYARQQAKGDVEKYELEKARLDAIIFDNETPARIALDAFDELDRLEESQKPRVYEVFLNIRKPKVFDAGRSNGWDGWHKLKQDVGYDIKSGVEAIEAISGHNRAARMNETYDGIIAKNIADVHSEASEDLMGDVFLVFDETPENIKSATETTGEFSESEDIRYSSRFDVNTNPTEAQKKAGNYKMGHLRLDGYNITIENPKGSVRRGTDADGNEWENVLNNDYGYIRGTKGVDGDHIDVYLSDNPEEGNVFVVDQVRPDTGEFDEHKVMYGFGSIDEAREAYLANFSEGWKGLGTITEVTKDEFRKWIDSSHRKTKPFSEYKSVKAEGAQSEGYEEEDITYSVPSTPTDEIVAEGMKFSIQEFARLAGNIFQALPEAARKEAIEETFKRGWDMQSAIFQIPARLAEKENWDETDKDLAKIIREKVQDAMDESGVVMSRPLTSKEVLWMLYQSTAANSGSMLDAAKRSIVAHNLGFDSKSMALKRMADDYIRYSVVRGGQIDAATDMYNYEANLWTSRLAESWLDMNQSVISLQNALAKASGKPIESWEDVELALNQLPSKSYAEKKKYLRDFLMPLWDQIIEMTKVSGLSIEQIERYMMLKHGLERNKKFAMRDAKQFYREMYDKVADRMKNTSHAEQVVALSEANKRIADIDAQIANASGKKLKDLQEAREREVVEKEIAELVLRNDEQQNEADLQMYFNAIEAENNPKYAEFREKDYGGLTSMFMDQIADVKRSDYKTDEAYQAALLASVKPRFDKVADMEAEAQKEVDDYESKAYMPSLWKLVNAATKETLRHQHAAGVITTEQYDAVRNMFDYYVPLRGFADNTAEDMYSYYMNNSAGGFAKPIIAAKGRKTRAESPLGWIGTMAESAIQQDNKNEVKMKLYYALMNRPDTGVLSLSEMWYVYDHTDPNTGKKVFVPAYPPATGGVLTADQMRQHMDAWEQSMKAKQAIGEAYKREQGVNLGGSVIFQDKAQDAEHIIRVKVAGKDYAILVNGNPRAAQAINGLLNPDANVGPVRQWYGALRRGLSALMTSFSPLFWVSNYQRDLLSSFMRTSLNEGWEQAFKYLVNRFHGWKAAKYIYRYDKGKMDNSYYDTLYKEFAENGGITGYTSLTTNKEYEKLLADYAENVDKEMLNWIKGVWDKFMGFGEAIEQVSRFAAYITARESGKSIEEAAAAAKEVSVNFNRKGSTSPISLDELEKLRDKNGKPLSMPKKAMAIAFSAMPSALKELYFFFNASIQALSSSAKLAKKSPGKAMAWAGMYMGLSVGLAFLNYLLAGDDDDNDYLDLPDYLRHSTALFKMGDNYYFKWSLPQEMRPFYATADILVSKIMGKTPHKTAWNTVGDIALAAAEWLPVNPFGTEDPILALVPDVAAPLAEIKANQNSFGGKIYNDMPFVSEDVAKEIPAYRKGTSKTGEIYVDMAEFLNDITGGDEVQKGIINLNPAMVEHLVEGYGGGIYDFGKLIVGIPGLIYDAVWGEGVEVREIPFVNKVLLSTDETNMNSHVNEAFYYYRGISENAERVENEYRQSDDPSRADDYRKEDDWRIHMLFRQYEEDLKMADEKVKKAVDDTEKDLALQEQNIIREMLLNDIASGKSPDLTTEVRMAIKHLKKKASDDMKPARDADKKRLERKRAGDLDGMLEAIQLRDSLKAEPRYQRAEAMKNLIKEIEDDMEAIGVAGNASQRDSLLGELQKKYEALMQKAAEEIE